MNSLPKMSESYKPFDEKLLAHTEPRQTMLVGKETCNTWEDNVRFSFDWSDTGGACSQGHMFIHHTRISTTFCFTRIPPTDAGITLTGPQQSARICPQLKGSYSKPDKIGVSGGKYSDDRDWGQRNRNMRGRSNAERKRWRGYLTCKWNSLRSVYLWLLHIRMENSTRRRRYNRGLKEQ